MNQENNLGLQHKKFDHNNIMMTYYEHACCINDMILQTATEPNDSYPAIARFFL